MSYTPIPFRSFAGGLNLRDAPDVVNESEAIDLLNVTFTERGALEQRDGYAQFTPFALTNEPDSVFPFYTSGGTKRLIVGNGSRLDALDNSGLSQDNFTTASTSPHFFTRFGGPTVEAVYIANGADQVRRYDVSGGFTSPAGLSGQTGKFLAVTPTSNRLVVARESGSTAGNNVSSVNFSDPGDPETFTSTNFIDLDPGDGEAIMGVCTYGDLVFIFKETKFWVHYGESIDTTGEPVFNVRKIDTGVGLAASRALAVGRDGVYFLARDGVYRTQGQGVELLSDKIDKFFLGGAEIYFKSNTLDHGQISNAAAIYFEDRFYLSLPTGFSTSNDRMLVFDPKHGWWTLYDIPASSMAVFRIGNQPELVFSSPATNHIWRHSDLYINDAVNTDGTEGEAVTARWRSGWIDYQTLDVKTIRESILTGSGELSLLITKDYEDSGGTAQIVTLTGSADLWQGTEYEVWSDGTDPTDLWGDGTDPDEEWGDGLPADDDPTGITGEALWGDGSDDDLWGPTGVIASEKARYAVRGRVFSTQLSNSTINTTFSVHRLVHHLRERRVPSVVATER